MNPLKLALQNVSTVISDDDFMKVAAALQAQAENDFGPIWEKSCDIGVVGKGDAPPPDAAVLAIMDDADQASALGYHDLTATGMPLGKVFAKTDLQYGEAWSLTASHELLELLADPWINSCVISPGGTKLYAMEVCDACEDKAFAYEIDGVQVSDFVTPGWFGVPGIAKMDSQGHIGSAFQLLSGGYIGYIDLKDLRAGWQQEIASEAHRNSAAEYARKSRFMIRSRAPLDRTRSLT